MTYETIKFETVGSVAVVTLNRPEKKNALNERMHRELIKAFEKIETNDQLKVLMLTGGPEIFCTGADLADVSKTEDGLPTGPNAIQRLADLTKPTIAAINGWCVAGGIELALSCDLRFVAETARIGDRHIRIGFIGGAGSPTRLTRLLGASKAMELVLSGEVVDGQEAMRIGLANRVFNQETLIDETIKFAGKMAEFSLAALMLSKKAIKGAADSTEYQSLHETDLLLLQLLSTAEYKEKIASFLSKKK